MRRLLFMIVFAALVFAVPVCAEEDVLLSESFETSAAVRRWEGGTRSDISSTDGEFSCAVFNPYGEETDGRVAHILFGSDKLDLRPGEIYRISFDVLNLYSENTGAYRAATYFGEGVNNIVFHFENLPDRWISVSAFFMVPREADYNFQLELADGDIDLGFLVDDLVVQRIDLSPERLVISGPRELTIPAYGEESTRYSVEAYTADGEIIDVLAGRSTLSAENLPAGVTFDAASGLVTVSSACPDGAYFTIVCTPPDYLGAEPFSIRVRLSGNVLTNSDFEDGDDNWIIDGAYDFDIGRYGPYVSLSTDISGPYGYRATLRPTSTTVLSEGVMYVFRALVRVESGASSSVYSQNTALSRDGLASINIIDLSVGDWTEVVAAFVPEATGIYDIDISFYTSEPGAVSVGNMTLSPEPPEETFITLHAPGNISVPATVTEFPMNAYIRDQAGQILGSRCVLSIEPMYQGVELYSDHITVSPDAEPGVYVIYASSRNNNDIESSLAFTVSYDNIADGSFEEYGVNQLWAAGAPATLRIDENIYGRFARIRCSEDFAVLMNNSYMHLYADTPYAFRANVVEGKSSIVTAFIATVDGDNVPVVQSVTDSGEIFELFQTDIDLVGRLMLYIASSDGGEIELALDDIELFSAIVSASSPKIRGLNESGATLTAEFNFENNLDPAADPSACAISWYGMSAGGESRHVGSGPTFVILPELVGRYIYFEVTPVCAVTGFSGTAMRSAAIAVGEPRSDSFGPEPSVDMKQGTEAPVLEPVVLPEGGELPFSDMKGHWAAEYILPMFSAGIVNGKTADVFAPDAEITRAEFAALVCRAFGMEGGKPNFADIPADAWYGGYAASLAKLDIVKGTSETEFSPEAPLTREQLLSILVRVYEAMGRTAEKASLERFYDHSEISPWAEDYVAKGLRIGLVNGTDQSTFRPGRGATRAEACTMLCRLLRILAEPAEE